MITRIPAERAHELYTDVTKDLEATHDGFTSLAKQLAEPIQAEKYSAVFTDMRGGILPALVVNGLAQRWAEHADGTPPSTLSLPGGHRWHSTDQQQYIATVRPLLRGKRSLVVTEVIAGGEGSGNIYASLLDGGIPVDVAAFQTYCRTEEYYRRWRRPINFRHLPIEDIQIYYGLRSASGDLLNTPPLVIARGREEDPGQYPYYSVTVEEQYFIMDAARKHLSELTDELYARHFPA